MKIAFVGLGRMGAGMTHRLLDAGHEVHAWNRSEGPRETLASQGGKPAASLEELVANLGDGRRAVWVMVLIALPAIEGEAGELQLARVVVAREVDELDVVAGARVAVLGREAEIALAREQHRILLHHAVHERLRHEIEAYRRDIGGLERGLAHERAQRRRATQAAGPVDGEGHRPRVAVGPDRRLRSG